MCNSEWSVPGTVLQRAMTEVSECNCRSRSPGWWIHRYVSIGQRDAASGSTQTSPRTPSRAAGARSIAAFAQGL